MDRFVIGWRPAPGAHGVVLGAAVIVGDTAGAARLRSKDVFAQFNDTAPIPVWSDNQERFQLNRGGNRSINTALHMAAVTQQRLGFEGAKYVARQLDRGKTRTEAMRLLREGSPTGFSPPCVPTRTSRQHPAP